MIRTAIKFTAALSVALPSLAFAADAAQSAIAYDGTQYTYTVAETPNGRVITGKTSEGVPFKLAVSKFSVNGHFNNNPVNFKLSEVKPLKGIVEVASR